MGIETDIMFYKAQKTGQEGTLEQAIQAYLDLDFELEDFQVELGERVEQGIQDIVAQAYSAKFLTFDAVHPQLPLALTQLIVWGENHFGAEDVSFVHSFTGNRSLSAKERNNVEYYSLLLEVGKRLYDAFAPAFGCIDYELMEGSTLHTDEDIEACQLRHLYWANFFGPDLLEGLGRDRVLNAPTWRTVELNDGGLLYLLSPKLTASDDEVSVDSVQRYWGVETVCGILFDE